MCPRSTSRIRLIVAARVTLATIINIQSIWIVSLSIGCGWCAALVQAIEDGVLGTIDPLKICYLRRVSAIRGILARRPMWVVTTNTKSSAKLAEGFVLPQAEKRTVGVQPGAAQLTGAGT